MLEGSDLSYTRVVVFNEYLADSFTFMCRVGHSVHCFILMPTDFILYNTSKRKCHVTLGMTFFEWNKNMS